MERRNVNRTVAALLAVGTLLAACGSDDDSSSDSDAGLDSGRSGDGAEGGEEVGDVEGEFSDETATTEAMSEVPPADVAEEESAGDVAGDASADGRLDSGAGASAPTMDVEDEFGESSDQGGGLFVDDVPADSDVRFGDNRFEEYGHRDFVAAVDDPLSTFALDVDTGSYSVGRRFLDEGSLPPPESVRPEEYVNAFGFDYDAPRAGLDISVDGGPSPFDADNVLVRVGVQGEIVADEDRGAAALTFVIDTSGSMDRDDRLGLVKESLGLLVDGLGENDTVAIVTYSDSSGVVLELASDGVANSGVTDPGRLAAMIREDADNGIDLVTVGFGMGNFDDVTMEQLADNGDGFYAYVDTLDEAERLFEDDLTSTLLTIAKDARIQVEFDDEFVSAYRLIGFENRGVRDSEFRDDSVDAGELGAGHQVTAIYEIELVDGVSLEDRAELGVVALRWEDPDSGEVSEIDEDIDLRDIDPRWTDTPDDFRLATVVVSFAEKLRNNPYADDVDMDDLAAEVRRLADELDTDEVDELADLVELAADLS